ncbi:hypothetical protein Scep_027919 [Stephania cephalantha]|uniref:Uncharacterized protein n=1 Tax=Stephania cephalantha TaxID=152367 RepID=A0AAP0EC64_9MAGN
MSCLCQGATFLMPRHGAALLVPRHDLARAKGSAKVSPYSCPRNLPRFGLARAKSRPNSCPGNVPRFGLARAKARPNFCPRNVPRFGLARAKARPNFCPRNVPRSARAYAKARAKWSRKLPNCLVPLLPPGSITASTAWSIATCSGHFRTCLGHASAHDQGSYPTAGNRLDLVHPHLKGLDPRFSKGQELLGGAWPCPGTGVLAGARLSPTGSG